MSDGGSRCYREMVPRDDIFVPYDPPRPTVVPGLWELGSTPLRTGELPSAHEVDLLNRGVEEFEECCWPADLYVLEGSCKERLAREAKALGFEGVAPINAHALNPRASVEQGLYGWHYDNSDPETVAGICVIGASDDTPGTVFDKDLRFQGSVGILYLAAGQLHSVPPGPPGGPRLALRWYLPSYITSSAVRMRSNASL